MAVEAATYAAKLCPVEAAIYVLLDVDYAFLAALIWRQEVRSTWMEAATSSYAAKLCPVERRLCLLGYLPGLSREVRSTRMEAAA